MPTPNDPDPQRIRQSEADELATRIERMLLAQPDVSFFGSLVSGLKEVLRPSRQGPVETSCPPMSHKDLTQSDEPELRRIADLERTNHPWHKTFFSDLKENLFPKKLPPLDLTSKPVQVKELLGKNEFRSPAQAISVAIHVLLVAVLFMFGVKTVADQVTHQKDTRLEMVRLTPPPQMPNLPNRSSGKSGGGGGGGDRSPLPPSKGALPKAADKQFTPPAAVLHNQNPQLAMEPTIVVPADVALPKVDMAVYGDPYAKVGPPSNGPGSGGGIGTGSGTGVGPGRGPGVGPGDNGGFGTGALRIGGGVSAPVPIFQPEPEYSEEARKAKYQGFVVLAIVVDTDGRTRDIRIVQSLGMGLDEKAKEAVMKWRFRPGLRDSKAVATIAQVRVSFRLL